MKSLKVIFFGTNKFSLASLKSIYENNHLNDLKIDIVCVCTKVAKPFGPKKILKNSDIYDYAISKKLSVKTYKTLRNTDVQNELKSFDADIGIVAAYGLILPDEVLKTFPLGCINVHGSILPKYRGAAPIQRAIMDGETESGITIMQMDSGIDTGDILMTKSVNISGKNFGKIFSEMSEIGGYLLMDYLINSEKITPQKQDDAHSSYAKKIENIDCIIDFKVMTASQIDCKTRALSPLPKSFFYNKVGEKIFILECKTCTPEFDILTANLKKNIFIKCSDGKYIQLISLQKQGKNILTATDFLNGNKIEI